MSLFINNAWIRNDKLMNNAYLLTCLIMRMFMLLLCCYNQMFMLQVPRWCMVVGDGYHDIVTSLIEVPVLVINFIYVS